MHLAVRQARFCLTGKTVCAPAHGRHHQARPAAGMLGQVGRGACACPQAARCTMGPAMQPGGAAAVQPGGPAAAQLALPSRRSRQRDKALKQLLAPVNCKEWAQGRERLD